MRKRTTIREQLGWKITPLVFACTSGMSRECGKFYSRLNDLLAIKKNLNNSTVMGWLPA